ncbi:flagellar hook assembly protein FlgD [Thalassomonas haliotis]|uniref:Basal-body rod modification protein FlgD n=1 Tax=Thalassomonas haliotis TaxID=485448 RepID=A0ABY7VG09_9GAMM|nr:flagellar hook capping FlgD N-terminal domain-containing protein [Thalassomonas haliotis]WDE12114.1 flagellar hook capping protein [Thalassomonas haliotis]
MSAITNDSSGVSSSASNLAANSGTNSAFGLKNEFLEMMVAQIQNQDPLDPLDGTEYVSQLAEFSMVEGIEYLRSGQTEQADLMYTQQVLQSTSLIGKDVLVPATSIAAQQGEKPQGVIKLDGSADKVVLKVKDLNGQVVQEQDWQFVNQDELTFELDELDQNSYVFEVEVHNGENISSQTPWLHRNVEKVSLPSSGGDIQLALTGMGSVSLFSVSEFSQNNS